MSCLQSNFYAAKRSRALKAGCSGLGFTINCFHFFVIVDSLQICFVLPPAQLDGASAFNRSYTDLCFSDINVFAQHTKDYACFNNAHLNLDEMSQHQM